MFQGQKHSLPLKGDKDTDKIQVNNISDFMVLSSTYFAVHFCQLHTSSFTETMNGPVDPVSNPSRK